MPEKRQLEDLLRPAELFRRARDLESRPDLDGALAHPRDPGGDVDRLVEVAGVDAGSEARRSGQVSLLSLGRLDSLTSLLPEPGIFL